MKVCVNCILPETFPGIDFDAGGVCNQCRKFDARKTRLAGDKEKYEQKFIDLLHSLGAGSNNHVQAASRPHDVLMAYSGGKDSTYTMSLLTRKYGLRVLALSFDNGFLSPAAVRNMQNVTDTLGVDHILLKPRWDVLRKIFVTASERELYSKKTLERASTICTSCIGLVKSLCLKTAIEQDIPLVAFGWSPGQAPIESSIMKNNPALIRMAQQAILQPMKTIVGDAVDAYFLQEKHYAMPERFPHNVHPMAWEFYSEDMILEDIRQYGWTAPTDTDTNSSNCLLNAHANDVHIKKYGFHPYVWEIANMVREGVMTREAGYRKIYDGQPEQLVRFAREKLQKKQ
jgi:predicted PP-loop superfamily ATPase